MDNPYKILDVSNTDSIEIITQKYRKLALKYHPDKNKSNNIDTTNKFIEISNAYNTIVKNHTKSVFNESSNKTKDSNTLFNNIAQNIINKSSNIYIIVFIVKKLFWYLSCSSSQPKIKTFIFINNWISID